MPPRIETVDSIVGHWTVDANNVGRAGPCRGFFCTCVCGTQKYIAVWMLKKKTTLSCGCRRGESLTTHGMTKHPARSSWKAMKSRCSNPKNRGYKNYGGRGIIVCERWTDCSNFIEDMLPTWKPGLSLERLNNNLGYFPENCAWVDKKTQQRNMRKSRFLDSQWGRITWAEASERTGIPYTTIRNRAKTRTNLDDIMNGYRPHNG